MRLSLCIPAALLSAGLAIACGDGGGRAATPTGPSASTVASCNGRQAVFTVSPIDTASIRGWVPLGNINPPAHTFPTDHQYIYLHDNNTAVPLYAPGDITIIRAVRTQYNGNAASADYAITFAACGEVQGEFGHVAALESDLLAAIGAFDQQCSSYTPAPGQTVSTCYAKPQSIVRSAGTRIGSTKGLDLSLFDNRVAPIAFANAARWRTNSDGFDSFHVVGFSDYYAEPMKSAIARRVGSFDGRTRRVALPIGGTIAVDRSGTAQGAWLAPGQPTYPETPHLTIAPDNVDPTRIAIGWGTPINGVPAQSYVALGLSGTPTPPSAITPGSGVACWEIGFTTNDVRGIVLVQLTDASTLRVDARIGGTRRCSDADATTLSASAVTFVR